MGEMLPNYFNNNGNSNGQIQLPNPNMIVPAKMGDIVGESIHSNGRAVQSSPCDGRAAQSSPCDGRVLESSPSGIQDQGAGGLEAATLGREFGENFRDQNDGLSCAVGDTSRVVEGAPMQGVALIELEEQFLHGVECHLCDVPISVVENLTSARLEDKERTTTLKDAQP
ncbi:formate dehydrogenase [Sesbania bispinosa]|nr:formate dehydrogenase [Sesbania bispinosa]